MLYEIVIFLTLTVICVSSQCDQGCQQYRQYTRVKRGRFYSNPPIRFYNTPPVPVPIKGPFSFTPPPFMADDAPSYPGSRPYKVSKRPTIPSNDGLGDDDITNLVKHLSKQDLDKILEFAQEKEGYNKYKDGYNTNEYTRPYKRESKILYKANIYTNPEEPAPYKEESKFANYVTEPTYTKIFGSQEPPRAIRINPSYRPHETNVFPSSQRVPASVTSQDYMNSLSSVSFPVSNSDRNEQTYVKVFAVEEPQRPQAQTDTENYASYQRLPIDAERVSPSEQFVNSLGSVKGSAPKDPFYTLSNEEEKLPPPENMREEDYEGSNTNNVLKVVKSQSSSYDVENFGDLPLMDYNSKLHDVSSYHVPHYTVTQPRPLKPAASSSSVSFPSSTSYSSSLALSSTSSSSTLLKPSPAAAAIKEPVYERAPSTSSAAEQSDAHLKAVKIWSHKSQGAAYTLHDDGSLTPERSRPKYG